MNVGDVASVAVLEKVKEQQIRDGQNAVRLIEDAKVDEAAAKRPLPEGSTTSVYA